MINNAPIIKHPKKILLMNPDDLPLNYFDKTYDILDSYKLYDYINDMYDDNVLDDDDIEELDLSKEKDDYER